MMDTSSTDNVVLAIGAFQRMVHEMLDAIDHPALLNPRPQDYRITSPDAGDLAIEVD